MNHTISVSGLNLFPIRSCAGISLQQARVSLHGLILDRNWRLSTPSGQFLTQRECPKMALLKPALAGEFLQLTYPGVADLRVPTLPNSAQTQMRIYENWIGIDQGAAVADWLAVALGLEARLLRVFSGAEQTAALEVPSNLHVANATDTSDTTFDFARPDMSPVLVISEESLIDLNKRLSLPVLMNRFRPNIVIRGGRPYAEEEWTRVTIGDVVYEASTEPCGRCAMVNIDQEKGEKAGKEPLKTLATYRRAHGAVIFGKYMVAQSNGVINVGDRVSFG